MALTAQKILDVQEAITDRYPDVETVWATDQQYNLVRLEYGPDPKTGEGGINLDVTLTYEGVAPAGNIARGCEYLRGAFSCANAHLEALAKSTLGLEGIGVARHRVVLYYPDRYYAMTGLKRPKTKLRNDHAFVVIPTDREFIAVFRSQDGERARIVEFRDGQFNVVDMQYARSIWTYVRRFHQRHEATTTPQSA